MRAQAFLAIEFEDGFDALFVRLTSEAHPDSQLNTAAAVMAEYERLNKRRREVLTGIRKHAASKDIAIRENADSRWDLQPTAFSTSELWVGPVLTRLVEQFDSSEALAKYFEKNWLGKLTVEEAGDLTAAAPASIKPARWKTDEEVGPLFGPAILALDCKGVEQSPDLPCDPTGLINTLAPTLHAPGQQVVNQLVEQVGRWRFSVDLLGKGHAQIEFTDKLDSYLVHPRSKRLSREASRTGIDATVNRLASEFRKLDLARGVALRLLQEAMADAGFSQDEEGDTWWFGETHRLMSFKPGRLLTLALRRQSPEEAVQSWLHSVGISSTASGLESLRSRADSGPAAINKRWLPREEPKAQDRLPTLAALDVAGFDRKAQECLDAAVRQALVDPGSSRIGDSEDMLYLWSSRFWYRTGDLWATERWWLEFARAAWDKHKCALAAVLLLSKGEQPVGMDYATAFNQFECWESEAFEDEILWLLVDDLPWGIDEWEYPRFPACLAPRPPQIVRRASKALRAALKEMSGALKTEDRWQALANALRHAARLDRVSAQSWLSTAEIQLLESNLKQWVRESDFQLGPDPDDVFGVAAEFGWLWLPETLKKNPAFIPAQFHWVEVYSDPGKVALRLSWVQPCDLVARFAAYALTNLPPNTLETKARRMAGAPDYFETSRLAVRNWEVLDQFAAAIAWQRCRSHGII